MVGNTTSVAAGIIITQKKDGSRQGEFDGGTRRLANLQMVWWELKFKGDLRKLSDESFVVTVPNRCFVNDRIISHYDRLES